MKQTITRILYAIVIAAILFTAGFVTAGQFPTLFSNNTNTQPPTQRSSQTDAAETAAALTSNPWLTDASGVIVEDADGTLTLVPVAEVLFDYIQVTDSCDAGFVGECLNVRSGPGSDFEQITQLRNGVILKVEGKVEQDDQTWYKITFDEWIRYPERVQDDWFINAAYVSKLQDIGQKDLTGEVDISKIDKRIVVDESEQMLRAYKGDELAMEMTISTGLSLTPTPNGTFRIFRKTPSRYMQGPIPGVSSQHWDLPGVPWNMYFTSGGAVIHGAYWHDNFGQPWSKGCVNVPLDKVKALYKWAPLGTKVIIQE